LLGCRLGPPMTAHDHPPGRHPVPAVIAPSILRLSLVQRLGIAAVLIAVLWGVVFWALV
jgi:hypothetical protein